MTIAIATLSTAKQNEFLRRKNQLTSDQRECLNKIMGDIAYQVTKKGGNADRVARKIADFIDNIVLTGYPDYCALYQETLVDPDKYS